ncbi:MAG: hypothetical protein BM557_07750 [Flavobacterium sp. MedPE-SWcel]|uniref:RHS repeat-associated core domain-containing protein n=1 Tax=uncultured Flavobacterium sp. TaxID=165435 RepID=UPI00091F6346|nr:RHS repeat-associated core domain-containing protein [uncultured Flavobacterium sp.]OIQ18101.1 MAG: hypothetical protein BM557_07750 [Flavobacterium sp. MedPE-SWcel]
MKKNYILYFILFISTTLSAQIQPINGVVAYPKPEKEITVIPSEVISLSTSNISPGVPTGPSTEVGVTKGVLSVSGTGDAVYNVPISTPPGVNGVKVDVSLAYNSSSGDGIAGYGWNISGVSSISRIPSTKFHDDNNDPIDFDDSDRFSLDGQRLILKSGGTYGADGAIYETEIYSNIKVTSYGSSSYNLNAPNGLNYGPAYFKVEYPNGSFAIYGNSTTSFSRTQWTISYWQNPQGLQISYGYIKDEATNSLVVSQIVYGRTVDSDEGPNSIVNFVYEDKAHAVGGYIEGAFISNPKILKEINSFTGNVGFRKYILEHNVSSLGYERLISITEVSGDGTKSLNPTIFSYDDSADTVSYSSSTTSIPVGNISSDNTTSISGDFDGDGKIDFILYPENVGTKNVYRAFFSGVNSDYSDNSNGTFKDIFSATVLTGNSSGYKLLPYNAWTIVKEYSSSVKFRINSWSGGTSSPGIVTQYQKSIDKTYLGGTGERNYYSGDFNGDGLSDIISVIKDSGVSAFIDLDKRVSSGFVITTGVISSIDDDDEVIVADYNGDGKSDLIHFSNGRVKVYTLVGFTLTLIHEKVDAHITTSRPILPGDYNGDGKIDFLIPTNYGTTYAKYISTGVDYLKSIVTYDIPYNSNTTQYTYHIIPNDMNHDGKTDLVLALTARSTTTDAGWISFRVFKNIGDSFVSDSWVGTETTPEIKARPLPIFLTSGYYNKNLEVAFISDDEIFHFQSHKDFNVDKLLRSITNGDGVKESITYTTIKDCSINISNCVTDYLQDENPENFPNFSVKDGTGYNLVSKLERQSYDTYKKQFYKYYGAVINYEGLGFLGFKSTMKTNWYETNSQLISSVSKYDVLKGGVLVSEFKQSGFGILSEDYVPSAQYLIGSRSNVYIYETLPNKVRKIALQSSDEYNATKGIIKRSFFVHDAYNNIVHSTYTQGLDIGDTEESVSNSLSYDNSPTGSTYYIGRLNSIITSKTHDGVNIQSEELYDYNDEQLLYRVRKKGDGDTDYIVEDNIYDVYGNITKKTISPPNMSPRETNYEYSNYGRFLTKMIDKEGLVEGYTYDEGKHLLVSKTDPYGLVTGYEYDSWGREKRIIDYLGKKKYTSYTRDLTNTTQTLIVRSSDSGAWSSQVIDDLGNEILSTKKMLDGDDITIESKYDIYGRLVSVSEPYGPLGATQFNTSKYDLYGRIIEETSYTGKVTTINYDGLNSTLNDGTKTITKVENSLGNMISVTDDGGTVNYKYFPNGNLKESNYDGHIVTVEQDGWGRKTKLVDPSAGTFKYEYNGFSQITKEVTPKGSTSYTYNQFGKVTSKYIVSGDYWGYATYSYNSASKLPSYQAWQTSDGSDESTLYSYDDMHRINFIEEYASYATYRKTYTYDDYGRIDTKTIYADNGGTFGDGDVSATKTIRKTYKNGYDWQVFDDSNNQLLWESITDNERGQLTTGKFGNGISATHLYDDFGFPKLREYELQGDTPTNVMSLTTTFNPQRGNLHNRSNNLFNWEETFEYDSLDRLIEYTNARGEQETQVYDDRGRITQNTFGEYTYDQSKVYHHVTTQVSDEAISYYSNKVGIYSREMENKDGWKITSPSITSYDTSKARNGAYSLKLSSTSTGAQYVYGDGGARISNAANTQYTISGWVYSDGPSAKLYLHMQTEAGMANGSSIASSITETTTGTWTYVEKIVNVANTIRNLYPRVYKSGSGNVWFDDIRIVKTSDATQSRALNIDYNYNKSPIEISETGVDKLSFLYNNVGYRSAMFYGSTDSDKLLRPLRKFYSSDGTIEIKQNMVTDKIEILMYIEGNGYTAPVVFKKEDTTEEYLYLHRDYLGSITAITDESGDVVEKRIFDAWGKIIKVQDGLGNALEGLMILDRGYTGHEHIQSVALINMNGRLYDPVLHRFLQPDNHVQEPYNTQNFNRYSYVLNNPLRYTDISGESFGDWWKDNWKTVVVTAAAVTVAVVVTVATGGAGAPLLLSLAYGGAAGGALSGGLTSGWIKGEDAWTVASATLMGAGEGFIMGYIGGYAARFVPPGVLNGFLAGGTADATLGAMMNLARGRNVYDGMALNFIIGGIGGGIQGAKMAKDQDLNIMTGNKPKPEGLPKPARTRVNAEQLKSREEFYALEKSKAESPKPVALDNRAPSIEIPAEKGIEYAPGGSGGANRYKGKIPVNDDGTGIPNSIYEYQSSINSPISRYHYDSNGNMIYQFDLKKHNMGGPHLHVMDPPGNIGSGHTPKGHFPGLITHPRFWQ